MKIASLWKLLQNTVDLRGFDVGEMEFYRTCGVKVVLSLLKLYPFQILQVILDDLFVLLRNTKVEANIFMIGSR